jgi:hypothetical protein
MCPPAAMSTSFRKLGPIVPSGTWWVVHACSLPGMVVSEACLVIVNGASCLNRGCSAVCGEGTRHWWRGWWFWGEGVLCFLSSLVCEGAEAAVVATVAFGEVGVVNRAVVPKVRVPLWQDAVGVVAVDVWGWTPVTPMPHS